MLVTQGQAAGWYAKFVVQVLHGKISCPPGLDSAFWMKDRCILHISDLFFVFIYYAISYRLALSLYVFLVTIFKVFFLHEKVTIYFLKISNLMHYICDWYI